MINNRALDVNGDPTTTPAYGWSPIWVSSTSDDFINPITQPNQVHVIDLQSTPHPRYSTNIATGLVMQEVSFFTNLSGTAEVERYVFTVDDAPAYLHAYVNVNGLSE